MPTSFSARQTVEVALPSGDRTLEDYLRTPERLVQVLFGEGNLQSLGGDLYRFELASARFLSLEIRPLVDLRAWWEEGDRALNILAQDCQLIGLDWLSPKFDLDLRGVLRPATRDRLDGEVYLGISLDLPPMLSFTPEPLVRQSGGVLLNGILGAVRQKIERRLPEDYRRWTGAASANEPT